MMSVMLTYLIYILDIFDLYLSDLDLFDLYLTTSLCVVYSLSLDGKRSVLDMMLQGSWLV